MSTPSGQQESPLRRFQRGQAALARSAKHDLTREHRRDSLLEAKELLGELPPQHEEELKRLSMPLVDERMQAISGNAADSEERRRSADDFFKLGLEMQAAAMKRRARYEIEYEAIVRLPKDLAVYGARTAEAMALLNTDHASSEK